MHPSLKLAFDAGAQEAQQGFNPKLAYEAGAQQALVDAGLVKVAQTPPRDLAAAKAVEELPFHPTLQTYDRDMPVPAPFSRYGRAEQIPGARDVEIARRVALGDGDFHGETNLINFDEQLRNYDPGAHGEFARAANYDEPFPGVGGQRYFPAVSTRREDLNGWDNIRPTGVRFRRSQEITPEAVATNLNRAAEDPSYTSDDIRKYRDAIRKSLGK